MQIYLKSFDLPSEEAEIRFFYGQKMTCYNSVYPFGLFRGRIPHLEFAPVTILYGGNGSGKTTILNAVAEKLRLPRHSPFNRSHFFDDYLNCCRFAMGCDDLGFEYEVPRQSRYIASDDVFQHVLSLRRQNAEIDRKRIREREEYQAGRRDGEFRFDSERPEDWERLERNSAARTRTASVFLRERVGFNRRERSNGESAFAYFTQAILEDGLYLLDEPENSLSSARQLELKEFIEDSARGAGDQFVIATHSPLFLAIEGAKIYDLDTDPVGEARWYELENARIYFQFFRQYENLFQQ